MTILQAPWGETTHSAETKPTTPLIVWGLPELVLWLVVVNETDGRCRLLTLEGIWSKLWVLIKLIVYHKTPGLFLGRGAEDKLFGQPAAPTLDRMERQHHGACWNDKTSGVWCKVSCTLELNKGYRCWVFSQSRSSLEVWERGVFIIFMRANVYSLFMPKREKNVQAFRSVSKVLPVFGGWDILWLK